MFTSEKINEIQSYVSVKLNNFSQQLKYHKYQAIILSLLITLVVVFGTNKIYDATTSAQHSTDSILDLSELYKDEFVRMKRDVSLIKNEPCTEEEMVRCEDKVKMITHQKELTQYIKKHMNLLSRCMKCIYEKEQEQITTVKSESTSKSPYAKMYKDINKLLHNEPATEKISSTEIVTEDTTIQQSTESSSVDNEQESTTLQNDFSSSTELVNSEEQSNGTEISSSTESVKCDDTRGQTDTENVQNRQSGSTMGPVSEGRAQSEMPGNVRIPFPCFILKGMIESKDLNSISEQNNEVQLLPIYNQNTGDKKNLPSVGKAEQNNSSNASFQVPLLCTYFYPQSIVPENKKIGDESQSSFRMQNPVWGYPVIGKSSSSEKVLSCSSNTFSCADESRCVSKRKWCDGRVDCPDASDEIKCNCKERISKHRLCDGYFDCPLGEDELGCFGCDSNSFRCDDQDRQFNQSNCVPITQRCDDIEQCNNGRDEENCSILSNDEKVTDVGYTDGFLHKNYKGEWYPVHGVHDSWITQACQVDVGSFPEEPPVVETKPNPRQTESCINIKKSGSFELSNDCNDLTYVKCDKMQCGKASLGEIRVNVGPLFKGKSRRDVVNEKNDMVGIVGGKQSAPTSWPFLVMILKDGEFDCGGSIIDERWILTAAHCLEDADNDTYFEVRAGVLRRKSFAATTQIKRAESIYIHPGFDHNSYQNDIALIHLSDELKFNKWVRPICLPSSANQTFVDGPPPGSECTVIGWGRKVQDGNDADNMREVGVEIKKECNHVVDQNDGSLCAGFLEGGKDACSGDSGGPLLCKSSEKNRWYAAGIVSHGKGCAQKGEYGVYTRVKTYSNWIEEIMKNPSSGKTQLSQMKECSGFVCNSPKGKCLAPNQKCNKNVDCLDAEDEIDCPIESKIEKNIKSHTLSASNNEGRTYEISENVIGDSEKSHNEVNKNEGNHFENPNETTTRNETESSTAKSLDNFYTSTSFDSAQTEIFIQSTTEISTTNPTSEADSQNQTESGPSRIQLEQQYMCKKYRQLVRLDARCDGNFDCEDGTDEEDCTCKEFLNNRSPESICNGRYDCDDMTDEEGCELCSEDEFKCIISKDCVYANERCNGVNDCLFGEDEADCITLTDGQIIHVDLDDRPHMCHSGILTEYKNGNWTPTVISEKLSQNKTELHVIAKTTCNYIGFSNAREMELISIQNKTMPQLTSDINKVHYNYSNEYHNNTDATYQGLKVTCSDTLLSPSIEVVNRPVPWQAAVYVEGQFRCTAILLDNNWLLSAQTCLQDIDPRVNYTVAVLGLSKNYDIVDGPYQQIIPVDSSSDVEDAEGKILHLKHPVNKTRYVQPIFLEKKIFPPSKNERCILLADSPDAQTTTLFLKTTTDDCPQCSRCFSIDQETSSNMTNENDGSLSWSGTVSCLGSGGWYPAAIFNELNITSFSDQEAFTSIEFLMAHIFEAIDKHQIADTQLKCKGIRCSLGNCVPLNKVCNGIPNCRGGSDEITEHCAKATEYRRSSSTTSECGHAEIRCANGRCVPKSAFCDDNDDCGDLTDEPKICTCGTFLNLTAPSRVCDGKRDCHDKSDEDPDLCDTCLTRPFCKGHKNESICVQDYVCDGEEDCRDGSDEAVCITLLPFNNSKPNVGRVMEKSFGGKHSLCLDQPANNEYAQYFCKMFDYKTGNVAVGMAEVDFPPVQTEIDQFYVVVINDALSLSYRKDVPMVRNVEASEPCFQLFLDCQ